MAHIALSPSVQILIRPDSAIQFGVDATRSGVLEVDPLLAADVVPILLNLRAAKGVGDVVDKLTSTGLEHAAALSLVEDLMAYGIVVEAPPGQVLILGRGSFVDATVGLLESSDLMPRTHIKDERILDFLQKPAVAVLVMNRLAHTTFLAPLLARRVPTYLSAAIVDQRGLIGPGRRDFQGPCLMCVDLHRLDVDPHWYALVTQQPNGPTNPDPITEAATAARLVAKLRADRWGTQIWQPGEVEEVDPHLGTNVSSWIAPHPKCPVCWD